MDPIIASEGGDTVSPMKSGEAISRQGYLLGITVGLIISSTGIVVPALTLPLWRATAGLHRSTTEHTRETVRVCSTLNPSRKPLRTGFEELLLAQSKNPTNTKFQLNLLTYLLNATKSQLNLSLLNQRKSKKAQLKLLLSKTLLQVTLLL